MNHEWPHVDVQYLRLLAGQIARDAQALHDAIPEDAQGSGLPGAAGAALATLGEGIHQYVILWEGISTAERLEDIGPWGEREGREPGR